MSGFDLSGVRVRRDSPEPKRYGALAMARGTEIHLGPGQDAHLPHEAAHVVQQLQGRVSADAKFAGRAGNTDARLESEATAMGQRAMTLGRTSRGESPSRSLRRAAVSAPVIQRVVDLSTLEQTANSAYMVDPSNRSQLYATRDATPPEPAGLYVQANERTTTGSQLRVYKPNVRLVGDAPVDDHFVPDTQRALETARPVVKATMAMLGKNDCLAFANKLRTLIAFERMRKLGFSKKKWGKTSKTFGVGGIMKHTFDGDFPYHGATVVAKDGASLITLEADTREVLSKPEFYIHAGTEGFIDDNRAPILKKTGHDVGRSLQSTALSKLSIDSVIRDVRTMRATWTEIGTDSSKLTSGTTMSAWLDTVEEKAFKVQKRLLEKRELEAQDEDDVMDFEDDGEIDLSAFAMVAPVVHDDESDDDDDW